MAERTLDQVVACAKFYNAFSKLLHMETYLVAHILEPGTNMLDIVVEHNIIEGAKSQIVQEYLPFTVCVRSRDVNMTPSVNTDLLALKTRLDGNK